MIKVTGIGKQIREKNLLKAENTTKSLGEHYRLPLELKVNNRELIAYIIIVIFIIQWKKLLLRYLKRYNIHIEIYTHILINSYSGWYL